MNRILIVCYLLLLGFSGFAQDIDIANQYLKQGEYEKAKLIYQKIIKDKSGARFVHENYMECLLKLKNYEEANKYLKKQIKAEPEAIKFRAEYVFLLEMTNNNKDSDAEMRELIEIAAKQENMAYELQDLFIKKSKYEQTVDLLQKARIYVKDENKFAILLARAFLMNGQKDKMLEELLKYGMTEGNIEYVKATIQDNFKSDDELKILEKGLYTAVQRFPGDAYYVDLLVWYLVQQKDFYKAFVQARALDRRLKLEGSKVFDLAQTALSNKDYKNAVSMFEYILKEYPHGQYYSTVRRLSIYCREELVKNTFPINKTDIVGLINDYQNLFLELGKNPKTMEALRNTAHLYAFYLNEKDTAITILETAIMIAGADNYFRDNCKLDLGDIYLLKNEPWESTLLYSQVEKSQKEEQLGQEAKLKNAKLQYFQGNFELAKEILDILKKATTREIANDALQLGLLIQDNTGLDSTETVMKEYAAIELLFFQNEYNQALEKLEKLYQANKFHSLADEMLWLKANALLKLNKTDEVLLALETIRKNFSTDILADDATYLEAELYEQKLNDKNKAMELYKEILKNFPGSIYGAEARKKFRQLRGDIVY